MYGSFRSNSFLFLGIRSTLPSMVWTTFQTISTVWIHHLSIISSVQLFNGLAKTVILTRRFICALISSLSQLATDSEIINLRLLGSDLISVRWNSLFKVEEMMIIQISLDQMCDYRNCVWLADVCLFSFLNTKSQTISVFIIWTNSIEKLNFSALWFDILFCHSFDSIP